MVRNVVYWILGSASLLLLLSAPSGAFLTPGPARGKVELQQGRAPTLRGDRAVFVWLGGSYGGGYHGGK